MKRMLVCLSALFIVQSFICAMHHDGERQALLQRMSFSYHQPDGQHVVVQHPQEHVQEVALSVDELHKKALEQQVTVLSNQITRMQHAQDENACDVCCAVSGCGIVSLFAGCYGGFLSVFVLIGIALGL